MGQTLELYNKTLLINTILFAVLIAQTIWPDGDLERRINNCKFNDTFFIKYFKC